MAERCPLAGGQNTEEGIPSVCMNQCGGIIDLICIDDHGETREYDISAFEECSHEGHEVVYSRELVTAPDHTSKRLHIILDMCEGCEVDVLETVREFNCPNN